MIYRSAVLLFALSHATGAVIRTASIDAIPRINATDCSDLVVAEGATKCRFRTDALDTQSRTLQLTVVQGGRVITCVRSDKGNRRGGEWHGDCDGNASDLNLLALDEDDDDDETDSRVWFGSLRDGKNICQISPNEQGEGEIRCIPAVHFTPTETNQDEQLVAPARNNNTAIGGNKRTLLHGFTPSSSTSLRGGDSRLRGHRNAVDDGRRHLFDDSGSTVDIMVVWTKAAECSASFQSTLCIPTLASRTNIVGAIQLAVAETNTAFVESNVEMQLRLVHAYREPDYVESTTLSPGFQEDLYRLQRQNDGPLDSVHAKRALYGADMVVMITDANPTVCGVGFVGGDADYMFSVVGYDCLAGTFAFAHEVAHNFGCQHDRGTEDTCSETDTYNYGYRDPAGEFRSIMAYSEIDNKCDNIASNENYHRAQRFSNPDISYRGKVMGSATENNARILNERKSEVASFFPAMNCQQDDECDDNDATTFDWCNQVNAACIFSESPPILRTKVPTPAPSKEPTQRPTQRPTRVPTGTPTVLAPLFKPSLTPSTFMEAMVVNAVQSDTWKTVQYRQSYFFFAPIISCTVQYDTGKDQIPAVVRMRNVEAESFDVRIQNPSNSTILYPRDIHCLVVGEGSWTLPDGRRVEATKYESNVTDREGSWVGEYRPDPYPEKEPVVFGQVMSSNDPRWSVFWYSGWRRFEVPGNWTGLVTGRHIGKDDDIMRANEMIGYIVIEGGHDTSRGIEIETRRGEKTASGYVDDSSVYSFSQNFTTVPTVAILSQSGMTGDEGSWSVLKGVPTATSMVVSVDEDQTTSPARDHAAEMIDFAVFSTAGSIPLAPRADI